jgi:hypothetical protein
MSEVAPLADRAIQTPDDFVGRRGRSWFGACRETSGERGSRRRDAGEGLAEPVGQYAPKPLPFAIGDLNDLPPRQFLAADPSSLRLNPPRPHQ